MTAAVIAPLPLLLPPPRAIARDVARHFTPGELRDARAFLDEHEHELPQAESGPIVFPDPMRAKIFSELKRVTDGRRRLPGASDEEPGDFARPDGAELEPALSDEDYQALINSAPDSLDLSEDIMARIEAAAVVSSHKPRRTRSPERFMSAIDEYVEPYLAVRKGMPLGAAAKAFGIADIQRHIASVEMWLTLLDELPKFNRNSFLVRLERAVEKRRKDATYRHAETKSSITVVVKELSDERQGLHIALPPTVKARSRKRDRPWIGTQAPVPAPRVEKDPKMERRSVMLDNWIGTMRPLVTDVSTPSPEETRKRQLERGLIAILDKIPFGDSSRELVAIVDMTEEGKSLREIALALDISSKTVTRRLEEVCSAAEVCPLSGVEVKV